MVVSIPSRGFWFFEVHRSTSDAYHRGSCVSIPSRGFWFFEAVIATTMPPKGYKSVVSIPSRGFWFFEDGVRYSQEVTLPVFQSPRGDFGFLKMLTYVRA